ncbi:hypothetical protein ACVWWU_004318 [Pantoea sp. PA1]|nr:hypothetical protein CG434_10560 [Pantoea ananatis]CRH35030.1 hypothetical protein BN1183_CC_00190 [Pantoea ananatis]
MSLLPTSKGIFIKNGRYARFLYAESVVLAFFKAYCLESDHSKDLFELALVSLKYLPIMRLH